MFSTYSTWWYWYLIFACILYARLHAYWGVYSWLKLADGMCLYLNVSTRRNNARLHFHLSLRCIILVASRQQHVCDFVQHGWWRTLYLSSGEPNPAGFINVNPKGPMSNHLHGIVLHGFLTRRISISWGDSSKSSGGYPTPCSNHGEFVQIFGGLALETESWSEMYHGWSATLWSTTKGFQTLDGNCACYSCLRNLTWCFSHHWWGYNIHIWINNR